MLRNTSFRSPSRERKCILVLLPSTHRVCVLTWRKSAVSFLAEGEQLRVQVANYFSVVSLIWDANRLVPASFENVKVRAPVTHIFALL